MKEGLYQSGPFSMGVDVSKDGDRATGVIVERLPDGGLFVHEIVKIEREKVGANVGTSAQNGR